MPDRPRNALGAPPRVRVRRLESLIRIWLRLGLRVVAVAPSVHRLGLPMVLRPVVPRPVLGLACLQTSRSWSRTLNIYNRIMI